MTGKAGKARPDSGGGEAPGASGDLARLGPSWLPIAGLFLATWVGWRLAIGQPFDRSRGALAIGLVFLGLHGLLVTLLLERARGRAAHPGRRLGLVAGLVAIELAVPVSGPVQFLLVRFDGVFCATLDYWQDQASGGSDYFTEGRRLRVDPETRLPMEVRYLCSRAGYEPSRGSPGYRPALLAWIRAFGPPGNAYLGPLPDRDTVAAAYARDRIPLTHGLLGDLFPLGHPEGRGILPDTCDPLGDPSLPLRNRRTQAPLHAVRLAPGLVALDLVGDPALLDFGLDGGLVLELRTVPEGRSLGGYHYSREEAARRL